MKTDRVTYIIAAVLALIPVLTICYKVFFLGLSLLPYSVTNAWVVNIKLRKPGIPGEVLEKQDPSLPGEPAAPEEVNKLIFPIPSSSRNVQVSNLSFRNAGARQVTY